jgi:hypothetical protein
MAAAGIYRDPASTGWELSQATRWQPLWSLVLDNVASATLVVSAMGLLAVLATWLLQIPPAPVARELGSTLLMLVIAGSVTAFLTGVSQGLAAATLAALVGIAATVVGSAFGVEGLPYAIAPGVFWGACVALRLELGEPGSLERGQVALRAGSLLVFAILAGWVVAQSSITSKFSADQFTLVGGLVAAAAGFVLLTGGREVSRTASTRVIAVLTAVISGLVALGEVIQVVHEEHAYKDPLYALVIGPTAGAVLSLVYVLMDRMAAGATNSAGMRALLAGVGLAIIALIVLGLELFRGVDHRLELGIGLVGSMVVTVVLLVAAHRRSSNASPSKMP